MRTSRGILAQAGMSVEEKRALSSAAVYDPERVVEDPGRGTMANEGRTTLRACEYCGEQMPENANFCAECGMRVSPGPARPREPPPAAAPTLMHFRAPVHLPAEVRTLDTSTQPGPDSAGPLPSVPSAVVMSSSAATLPPGGPVLARTIVGLPTAARAASATETHGLPAVVATPAVAPAPDQAVAAEGAPYGGPLRTMLGVAVPGVAPLRPDPSAPSRVPAAVPAVVIPPAAPTAPVISAMSGVRDTVSIGHGDRPEPTHSRALPPVAAIVPPPEPLADLPTPVPPRISPQRGVPLTAAALTAGCLVLIVGLSIAWFWRAAPPLTAEPFSSPDGRDMLRLRCDPARCPDGTTVEAQGTRVGFKAGEAELALAEPLRIGPNTVAVRLERPGLGRHEQLTISVPLAFRVRVDLARMNDPQPSVVVRAQAVPGSDVTVDGQPVTLDATGTGAYALDESRSTEGPADESHVIAIDVPYTVRTPASADSAASPTVAQGTVSARVTVAPLRVDAPGSHAVIDSDHVTVAGRAARGAAVTIDGRPVETTPDGLFEKRLDVPALGERRVEVRSGSPMLATRTVPFAIRRVASLAAAARELESREAIGYDDVMRDLVGSVGKAMVVDGEVIDARTAGHRTVALIDDHRGCKNGPCLARVVLAEDVSLLTSKRARAYGRMVRPYTTSPGHTVPEIEADFIVQAPR